eukprot:gnl/MRDRNA2_/MRDRNA2_33963_c0_seq1.p1 gnl/MRDRNA2_/MRDRNA2_33963_c0~~gnl/MRDRNA2_/MRDRNA2_33963_c0_seq1.p1  ORF type:complete len:499 (+),score=93.06 gnl/MRDRNA2_/MRDRNA2_33963_c0_seq1:67-1563(+)
MPRLASVPFLLMAFRAQETRPHHFLRGMSKPFEDQLPVRRLEGAAPAAGPSPAPEIDTALPVLRQSDLHLSGYNMLNRTVTLWWEGAPGLTWEVQVQRWNRYGDEVLASWVAVGTTLETVKEMQTHDVFVDLQRYLYAFRVRAVGSENTKGAFSSPTDLYGELVGENATIPQSVPALQINGKANEPEVLKLSSDFPVQHRGDQAYIVLNTIELSLDLDVHPSFATFFTWAHEAFPILRMSISKFLNESALVQMKSGELFLDGKSCNYNGTECSTRKYAALNVSVIVTAASSSDEYQTKVNRVLESLSDVNLLRAFVPELIDHDVLVPDGLSLIQTTAGSIQEMELSVDVKSEFIADRTEADSEKKLYLVAGGGVIVLIACLVICFLGRKYRQLSQVARELNDKHKQHEQVMSDLEKQALEIIHEMEEVHHARDTMHHDFQLEIDGSLDQAITAYHQATTKAISIQSNKVVDPLTSIAEVGNEEALPNLLSGASAAPKK